METVKARTTEYFRQLLKPEHPKSSGEREHVGNTNLIPRSTHAFRRRLLQSDNTPPPLCSLQPPSRTPERRHMTKPTRIQEPQHTPCELKKSTNESKLWIHCNYCFEPYIRKRRPTFLLSCQHVLCESCLKSRIATNSMASSESYGCAICKKIVRVRQIANDMPSHLKDLFHPDPWELDLPILRIKSFQTLQREHLMKAMSPIRDRLKKSYQHENQVTKEQDTVEKEFCKMQHYLTKLRRMVRNISAARKHEKAMRENKAPSLTYTASASSATGSNFDAQRRVGSMRTRGGSRGRSPLHLAINRSFVEKKTPTKTSPMKCPDIVYFQSYNTNHSTFNL